MDISMLLNQKKSLFYFSSLLLLTSPCYALIGMNDYGYGTRSKSMGGATVADPEDALISAANPAGIVYISRQAELGLTLTSPRRGYEANSIGASPFGVAPGKHWSRQNYFFVPNIGYVNPIGTNGAYGIALYGNGGLNTNYSSSITGSTIGQGPGVFGGGVAYVDIKQIFLNLSFAWKFHNKIALGASLLPVLQTLDLKGISSFAPFSADPAHLSNNNSQTSTGLGISFGGLYDITDELHLGMFYQPRISMSKFSKYAGTLPNHGSFDVPATGVIGLSYNPRSDITLNVDMQKIWYSGVPALSNPNSCSLSGGQCLGIANGTGFGWSNPLALKLGAQWKYQDWALRAGYVHLTRVIPSSQVFFNIFAPVVATNEYTMGFSRKINKTLDFNLGAMYAPLVTISGSNQFNSSQTIKIFLRHYELFGSLTWHLA